MSDLPYNFADAVRTVSGEYRSRVLPVPRECRSEEWDGSLVPKNIRLNAALRRDLLWRGGHSASAARQILDMCSKDILFWVNMFCYTYDPRLPSSVVPFITYQYQDRAMLELADAIESGQDVGIKKSRDMGASWVNLTVFAWFWRFKPMKSFLMVSRNEDLVDARGDPDSLFWKIDFLFQHQPKWLLPREVVRTSMHMECVDTGSVIDGQATTGDVGRGGRKTALLIDEFAAFETKAGYDVLSATRDTTRCRVFNSTPKGSANAFYDVIHKTAARIISMHWSEHPEKAKGLYSSHRDETTGRMVLDLKGDWKGVVEVRTKGEAKSRKVAFPEDYPFVLDGKTRSPWYDLQCTRCVSQSEIGQELDIDFLGSDYQFFDAVAIERYKDRWCREPEAVADVKMADGRLVMSPSPKGQMRIFDPLGRDYRPSAERRFVMGVDVAAGTGASNSTISVYDRQSKEKVAEYANPNVLPDDFGRVVVAVARWFNDARIVPDRSGPTGEVLVRRILAEGYTNIYVRRNHKKFGAPATDEPGVWLNPATRTQVLTQYRDAIGHCAVVNRSALAMDECLRFVCRMDGTVEHSASANAKDPSGARANHGDMVIADALAALCLGEAEDRDVPQETQVPYGSVAWRMRFDRIEDDRDRDVLGKEWDA